MLELRLIPLGQLEQWADNPSLRTATHTALWQEFVEHIRAHGQLMPIVVVPTNDGRYRIVDGHRRVKALGELGYVAVWAFVVPWSWEVALQAYGLAEQLKLPWTGKQLGEIVRRIGFHVAKAMLRPRTREILARAYENANDPTIVDEALKIWGARGLNAALKYVDEHWPLDRVLRAMLAHGSYRDLEDRLKGAPRKRALRRALAHDILSQWEHQAQKPVRPKPVALPSDQEQPAGDEQPKRED